MQGDFSRLTFDPKKQYRAVRMQQGRVLLDADWNEQIDIFTYYTETQLKDVLGVAGAPAAHAGFQINIRNEREETHYSLEEDQQEIPVPDFRIGSGRYYVDGILCENEHEQLFTEQPAYLPAVYRAKLKEVVLVYLDSWSRHITSFEDPLLREVALGGIDTTTRVQTVWQVKLLPLSEQHLTVAHSQNAYEHVVALPEWSELLSRSRHRGRLSARHNLPTPLENQLYRVEIHRVHNNEVTFKWSRENGSLLFGLEDISQIENRNGIARYQAVLGDQLRDKTALQKGDWVEFIESDTALAGHTLPLYQVVDFPDFTSRKVTLAGPYSSRLAGLIKQKGEQLLLRRWDYDPRRVPPPQEGTILLCEDEWQDLELGIQVRFSSGGTYTVGDYWLIPARTLTDTIEWPTDEHGPLALPPRGIDHHYCPLALLHFHEHKWRLVKDLRQLFMPLPALSAQIDRPQRNLREICLSKEELAVGDLVSLVPSTKHSVERATVENARLLLGIITEKEIEHGEQRYQVTIYGRAHCKVVGPVEWGDLLTVSHQDGCARALRSEHISSHHGAILGKALDAYLPDDEDGIGLIEVMVTLQ
ncbi:MAG TPA: DUF6519 domain-containing protein [Ktedonobacteraceae bacterium]|jgi:hypothetical protein|nr:DUF6519 domain-containing protein [Ktedonobacteraceae bacterium]